jgi:hypothetical protein
MTVISPFKNHMPLLPDIWYLPTGDKVHNDYTSLLKKYITLKFIIAYTFIVIKWT